MFDLFDIRNPRVDGWGALLDVNQREKQLIRCVNYRWEDRYGLQFEKVSQGFQFDGASKWAAGIWRVMGPPWGASAMPGCLHDWAFCTRFQLSNGKRVTFEYSAALYLVFLEHAGVSWTQRNIEYLAVLSPIARRVWNAHNEEFGD